MYPSVLVETSQGNWVYPAEIKNVAMRFARDAKKRGFAARVHSCAIESVCAKCGVKQGQLFVMQNNTLECLECRGVI